MPKLTDSKIFFPVLEKTDYCIVATGETTSTIQEVHIIFAHTLCECVERAMFAL